MKRFFLFVALIGTLLTATAQTEHIVSPSTADPLSGAPNNNHFVYTNPDVAQKNKLFLFFPGTNGVPIAYRKILKLAANLGYHAIGLTYPNDLAINDLCTGSGDITCHSRARLEVFDGTDRHPDITVDENNCIQRRTQKLLQYLAVTYPSENWGQYMDGNTIQWDKIMVSGHSQGGGHAGIISKLYEVDRVVMFAATDWVANPGRNADWITWDGPTPANKYYGFIHRDDEMVNFLVEQITWQNYGMDDFGALTRTDTATPPYGNSHMLYTELPPDNDPSKFHGSVVADLYTPMDGTTPIFTPVWTHMITHEDTTSLTDIKNNGIAVWPNPFTDSFTLNNIPENSEVWLYDTLGRRVDASQNGNHFTLKSTVAAGVYLIQIKNGEKVTVRKLVKR